MQRKTQRLLVVVVALTAVGGVVAGGVALAGAGAGAPSTTGPTTSAAEPTPSLTLAPPPSAVAASASASESSASASSASAAAASAPPSSTGAVATSPATQIGVVLGYADWDAAGGQIEAAGFADAVESGGTCTLELTSGSQRVQVSAPADPDATTTNCGRLTVPADRLSPGGWTVTLSYRSARSAGTSDTTTVTVPAP